MEEFIFDDDVDDVGAEVEALCPKCKADTTHVIVSKYEDEIRRVQCNPCGDIHAFRKPRGDGEEEGSEPTVPKKKVKAKPTWDQVMAKSKKAPRPYAIGDYFKDMEVLSHPKFGVGYVTDNIGDDKIEVTFKEDKRVLIHNRKNLTLPFLRPIHVPKATPKANQKGQKGQMKAVEPPTVAKRPEPPKGVKPAAAKLVPAKGKLNAAKGKPPVRKAEPKAAARPASKRPESAKASTRTMARPPAKARPSAKAAKAAPKKAARPVPARAASKKLKKKSR